MSLGAAKGTRCDGKRCAPESLVNRFVVKLLTEAITRSLAAAAKERARILELASEAERAAESERRAADAERFDESRRAAADWSEAELLRASVAAVRSEDERRPRGWTTEMTGWRGRSVGSKAAARSETLTFRPSFVCRLNSSPGGRCPHLLPADLRPARERQVGHRR